MYSKTLGQLFSEWAGIRDSNPAREDYVRNSIAADDITTEEMADLWFYQQGAPGYGLGDCEAYLAKLVN